MTPSEYVSTAAERMRADGSTVASATLGRFDAIVGYQSTFKVRWFATKLHTFTVLAATDIARDADLRELIAQSLEYAKATKGKLRGLQTGVAVIPVLVASSVEPAARALAESPADRTWLAFARPGIVDVTASQTYTYEGRQVWGGIYNAWIRARLAVVSTS